MCVVEQKTYYQPDGSQKAFDRVHRCDIAINSGIDLCPNATRTSGAARIVEVKPETTTSSSTRKNEIVTENNGHTHIYRPLGRRASQKHKTGHSKHSNDRNTTDGRSSSNSRVFETFNTRRASPASRPTTPISAPPRMDSFPPTLPPEPSVRVRSSGTAVYDLPPSRFNVPRAADNERRPAEKARKVSFGDGPAESRRPSLSVHTGARDAAHDPPTRASPGLSRPGLSQLPSFRHKRTDSAHDVNTPRTTSPPPRNDQEYVAREAARETARRQRALDEAIRRRQEELEAAENRSLDREAERARYRRSFDPLHRLPETSRPPRSTTDSDHSSWSRHTSPPAPPSHPRPAQTRTRFASSSPLSAGSSHRHRSYGQATIHHYHYPDNPAVPASGSRRTSDAIRERGREVIERERAKAANEDSQQNRATAAAEEYIARPGTSQRWEAVFDEVDERTGSREYYYVTEGSARSEIRRRRDRDDSRRREERRDEFFR
jgi:hypothetical protein